MTNLAELELDEHYYLKLKNGKVEVQKFIGGFVLRNDDEIDEVLKKVPSYEEWKALESSYEITKDANLEQATWMVDMEKENATLKELLKECKLAIFDYPPYDLASDKIRLQIKIDKALGEE